MPQEWIVGSGATAIGPLTTEQLKSLAAGGKITPDTPVRTTEMSASVPAKRVQGLFTPAPVKPAAPALPPPPTEIVRPVEAPQPTTGTFHAETLEKVALPEIPPSAPPPLPPAPAVGSLGIPAGESLFKEDPPSAAPKRDPARPPTQRFNNSLMAPPRQPTPKPPPPPNIPLDTPRWIDLWPLFALVLGTGWVMGGLAESRYFSPDSLMLILLLMVASVPMASMTFLHWLRPRQVPWGTAVGAGAFTAIGGVMLLLGLHWAAFSVTWAPLWLGKIGLILLIPKLIGIAYLLTESANIFLRWIGYVAGVGLCEETVKLLPLVWLIMREGHKRMGIHTFMAIGFASGLGFGISEAFYLYNPWERAPDAGSNLIRWFCCVPSHALWTAACSGFLWKWQTHLEYASGFWEKTFVVVKASGAMALLHGTYDTVCSYGLVAAAIMDAVTFPVLAWLIVHFTIDESDPANATEQPSLHRLRRVPLMAGGLVAASVLAGAALLGSIDEKTWMPAFLRHHLTGPIRPYIAGIAPPGVSERPGESTPPISARFALDLSGDIEQAVSSGIIATLTNTGETPLKDVVVICIDEEGGEQSFDYEELAPGESLRVAEGEWEFVPHEKLAVSWEGHEEQVRFKLP